MRVLTRAVVLLSLIAIADIPAMWLASEFELDGLRIRASPPNSDRYYFVLQAGGEIVVGSSDYPIPQSDPPGPSDWDTISSRAGPQFYAVDGFAADTLSAPQRHTFLGIGHMRARAVGSPNWGIIVPHWLILLLASVPPGFSVYRWYLRRHLKERAHRRFARGLCTNCGYGDMIRGHDTGRDMIRGRS